MPDRPDAATWARELFKANGWKIDFEMLGDHEQADWRATAEKALTLHAQAVAEVEQQVANERAAREAAQAVIEQSERDYWDALKQRDAESTRVSALRDALKTIRDSVRNDSDLRAMRITGLVNQALGERDDSEYQRAGPGFTRPT